MHTSFWKLDLEDIADAPTHVAFSLSEVNNIVRTGWASGGPGYMATAPEAVSLQLELAALPADTDVWVIGASPALDINPALDSGCRTVWVPTSFGPSDIEPMCGETYVAFTEEAAETIVKRQARSAVPTIVHRFDESRVLLGGGMVVD